MGFELVNSVFIRYQQLIQQFFFQTISAGLIVVKLEDIQDVLDIWSDFELMLARFRWQLRQMSNWLKKNEAKCYKLQF